MTTPRVMIGIVEAWDRTLGRGRVLAQGAVFHFTAADFFGAPGERSCPGLRVDFVPAVGVRTRVARQVRVIHPEPAPAAGTD